MKATSIYNLTDLMEPGHLPCITVYEKTHRGYPGNQPDSVRFRKLVKEAETALMERYPDRDPRPLLNPLQALAEDHDFWNQGHEGLAVFVSPDLFRVYSLNREVPEGTVVSERFHLKPLIRLVQSADRYQVLCLSRDSARLFEGNRDGLEPITLSPDIPSSNDQALQQGNGAADDRLEHVPSHRRHANEVPSHSQRRYGTDLNDIENDATRFFRTVDRAILEKYSKPSGLPLVLVALAENQELFRNLTHNSALIGQGVVADPQALSVQELRESAWSVAAMHYKNRMAELVASFEEARARGHATADLSEGMKAALLGQVRTLLLDADRVVPGQLDSATGVIRFLERDDSQAGDLLEDLAERVLADRGEVIVVPTGSMPTSSGLAAIYRY